MSSYRDDKNTLSTLLTLEDINRAVAEFVMRRHQRSGTWKADLDWSFDVRARTGLALEEAEKAIVGVMITGVAVSMRKKS